PHIANQQVHKKKKKVNGFLTEIDGESMYCIENFDQMEPFLMSIVSSSDLWMFVSSSGGLTAGRQNCNNALFPYYTDDKIHDSSEITGPKTIVRVTLGDKILIWEPFSKYFPGVYNISRNLYKNTAGSRIIFEEINHDLEIKFSYSWSSSEELGWIRKCSISNLSAKSIDIEILDGLQNVIPYGITRETQSMMSTLMDAYKVAEWIPYSNLALFRMSSIPVDRAEPSEALKTNCIWTHGLNQKRILLSSKQISNFRFEGKVDSELEIFGQKTAIFVSDNITLSSNESKSWFFVAEVSKDSSEIVALQSKIQSAENLEKLIEKSIADSEKKLHNLVSLADGIQKTGDTLNDRRHFANVMFNIMRGGIFENGYEVNINDFLKHLEQSNKLVFELHKERFSGIESADIETIYGIARQSNDADLIRISFEYLPISFSRRHGDPSRPWNFFDINIKNPDGTPSLNYQGNWRDIFQNWETLGFSFPEFLPGMICRFLNASTADGYNPYRITRDGFDWEVPEPDNPWAYIGYWGDHQIIYLLKFLELFEKFYPGQIFKLFNDSIFVYSNVPYQIKNFEEIIKNPQDTIIFDRQKHSELIQKSETLGSDGKLFTDRHGNIARATFMEKILVSLLTKLSNFVPDAGIWLNTQRPEWNDANNALVGHGTSMVTLYHMRRFVKFLSKIITNTEDKTFAISSEVHAFWLGISSTFLKHYPHLHKGFSNTNRKSILFELGEAGSNYRQKVYNNFSGDKSEIEKEKLLNFFDMVVEYIDHSISTNKRSDGLYHSYNLLEFNDDSVQVQNLQLMLEGQAAIISSEFLNAEETTKLMDALFRSELWRPNQQSFMLYPTKKLPSFLEKNIIPKELVESSLLLQELVASKNNPVIKKDIAENFHFCADIKNVHILKSKLNSLPSEFHSDNFTHEVDLICSIYESVFQHRFFTGRSGSFYKYEGIGSIYWHLVSKLLLNLGESIIKFSLEGESNEGLQQLVDFYHRVKEGIGVHKNPKNYGAFPTDPYSHTPSMMGAQQPGMTGQVKEDILSRFNELGLTVCNGEIKINPILLNENDFNQELHFTYCNTPFHYLKSDKKQI
ncbi:MAG TPA: hypothetical protein PL017_14175, partial [Tenuifilaceae bacterium]|nr:hypothetical protein [Tenuifilaceae bacterium]